MSPFSVRRKVLGKFTNYRISVPCGVCSACLSNRREGWRIRLSEEAKDGKYCYFITLTYDENSIVYGEKLGTVVKADAQTFIKDFRARLEYHHKAKFRYYLVAEYGTRTFRPHYHILAFSTSPVLPSDVDLCWGKGNTLLTPMNERRISYCAKFHVNRGHYPGGSHPPFALMSKGIGRSYIDKMKRFHSGNLNNMYYPDFRVKRTLPRYYKEKLYTKKDREKLGLLYSSQVDSDVKVADFIREHPGESYFLDVYNRYKEFQRKFKEKSNFNNQL